MTQQEENDILDALGDIGGAESYRAKFGADSAFVDEAGPPAYQYRNAALAVIERVWKDNNAQVNRSVDLPFVTFLIDTRLAEAGASPDWLSSDVDRLQAATDKWHEAWCGLLMAVQNVIDGSKST